MTFKTIVLPFYAKLVRMEKIIKTSAVFNTPGESNVKLATAYVAHITKKLRNAKKGF